jgi:hypothetical protein
MGPIEARDQSDRREVYRAAARVRDLHAIDLAVAVARGIAIGVQPAPGRVDRDAVGITDLRPRDLRVTWIATRVSPMFDETAPVVTASPSRRSAMPFGIVRPLAHVDRRPVRRSSRSIVPIGASGSISERG